VVNIWCFAVKPGDTYINRLYSVITIKLNLKIMILSGKGSFFCCILSLLLHIVYYLSNEGYYMAEYVAKMGEQHARFGWESLKGK